MMTFDVRRLERRKEGKFARRTERGIRVGEQHTRSGWTRIGNTWDSRYVIGASQWESSGVGLERNTERMTYAQGT